MADDIDQTDQEQGNVATAPVPEGTPVINPAGPPPPPPVINHGRALGFSRRGNQVPRGSDAPPAQVPEPSDTPPPEIQPPEPGMPAEPLAADATERHAAARAALLNTATSAWKDAYSNSQPVSPNGPVITPKQYRDAEIAADRQAGEAQSQNLYTQRTNNAKTEAQMRASGQQFYRDGAGNVQPVLETGTGRALFHGTGWEEGIHPQTGEPTLTKVDRYGQRQYKPAPLIAPTDTSDNQLYYKMPDGTLTAAGDMDKLMNHADPRIARTAHRAVAERNSAMWKEAIKPMEDEAGNAIATHEAAKQQSGALQSQIDDTNAKIEALDPNTMKATEGGIMGFGAKPTAAAIAETNKMNALQAQLDGYTKQKDAIDATTKAGGSLELTRRNATLGLAIFKAKAGHDGYLDAESERKLILKTKGVPETEWSKDPTLQSIQQAKQTYANAISKYGGMAATQPGQPAPLPRASHDELVKTSGTRLPVGAPVPGQPGLFASGPELPQKYDPAQEAGVGGDPATGTPSKLTMVGQSATSPAPAAQPVAGAAAPKPVPGAAITPPAGSPAGKIDPTLASEPFAQAARGVKNIGEVSMSDMAKRYGSGQGPVQPNSLVKIKNRLDDINSTLNDPKTQLDGKVRDGLQKEQDYLTSLSTQRFARLTPEQQQRVTDVTRDPTFWDKIKGAGKSLAEAAAEGGAGVMKGMALAHSVLPGPSPMGAVRVANDLNGPDGTTMAATQRDPLFQMGSFIDAAAKETYAKNPHEDEGMVSQALNEAAKGAGGFAPLVASGPAAPLTIGLQTAGQSMEPIYQNAIAKGMRPDQAAKMAVNRALLSGGVQAALFALLPKPLQKATSKLIVDKIAGNALTKFLTNRVAQATEGAVLGGTSAAASNVAEGRPAMEGVAGAATGLGAIQALSPRGAHAPEEPPAPQSETPPPAAAPVEPAPAAEPFKPTGEGAPKSAAESAKTLVPDAEKGKADVPPPAKSAEESAQAFKAHEELNRRAAAKEESAQKLVDQIQDSTGKSRGEILATRAGKDIDAWHDELKKEAKYQKNPLVVDPERRATELRADLKRLDAEWQDHVTKTGQEAEAAAEIQKLKDSQPAKSAKEAAAEADRQKALGVELPEARTQARHDALTMRREAIENELTAADRLRKSGEGGAKLKEDLAAQEKGTPPEEPGAPAKNEPTEPAPGPEAQKAGPTKLAGIKAGIADKDTTYHYNVYPREAVPEGHSRVMQVDLSSPNAPESKSDKVRTYGSTNLRLLKELGHELPDVPESLEKGTYTLDEIKAAIAKDKTQKGEPSNATTEGQQPQNRESEHPRVPQGTDVSKNSEQVRSENGTETVRGGGAVAGEKATAGAGGESAPREGGKPVVRAAGTQPEAKGEEAVRPEVAKPGVGQTVKFTVPGLHGPSARIGKVTRIMPDGKIEVRMAQGGYHVADASEFQTKDQPTASAGEQPVVNQAEPQPSAKGAAAAVPAAGQEGSGTANRGKYEPKAKVIGIGNTPRGNFDILNHVEQAGGIKTRASAKNPGGEYDDQALPGVAARLLRKDGVKPDTLAQDLHAQGLIPDGTVESLNSEIRKAVVMRQKERMAMQSDRAQQKRGEYLDKFERAFFSGEQKKEWLRDNKPVTVDQLAVGNHFEVNGEKFTVKDIDEHGNVTIEDGITRTVPAGTRIFPDKGKIKGGKLSTDFAPEGEAAAPAKGELLGDKTPFNLAGEEVKAPEAPKAAADKGPEMFAPEETRSTAPTAMDKANNAARESAAKKAEPEPTTTEAPRKSMDDDTRKPPAQMSRAERAAELTDAGVKEINGKPLADATPAEIINAVGKLRRGQLGVTDEPKKLSDKLIDALNNAKINKPGSGKVLGDPTGLATAYDSALDLAILGVKAGRELAHMVKLAVTRLKAAYPGATTADQARLEKAIRDAHASVHGTAEAPKAEAGSVEDRVQAHLQSLQESNKSVTWSPAQLEREAKNERNRIAQDDAKAKADQKAAAVISSPQAEASKSKIVKAWNDASQRGDIKDTLVYTREAGENMAKQTGREAETSVDNALKRALGKDVKPPLAGDAIGMHVEAGEGGIKALDAMKAKLEASTKADPKWKARAIAAIDFAKENHAKMQPAADLYKALTDAQAEREQAIGMPTLKRNNYVMHAQDIEDGTWLEKVLDGETGAGMSPTGASSRKNRVFDTHADSISAGTNPKTLDALTLLSSRISAGETGVAARMWQDSLHNYIDPASKKPIVVKPARVERADGSTYYQEPPGYKNEFLGGQVPIAVKKEYRGIIGALTNPSFFQHNQVLKTTLKLNAAGKSIALVADTYHLGRVATYEAIAKAASLTDPRLPIPSYAKGLNILDHSPSELATMAKNGEIDPKALPHLIEQKATTNRLIRNGYNIGQVGDAMHQELIRSVPGLGTLNKFIFEKFTRGAMQEVGSIEYNRQSKAYPELSQDQVARQVAKDLNTRFGNIGRQGWFKSRSAQDISRLAALAPGWNEGLIKSEVGGVSQIGKSALDAVRGKRLAMGFLGRQMVTGALGIFAANQIVNQMTRGKFTWQNPEEEWGSKLSAWIPDKVGGKSSGFFLNPLGIMAEVSHLLLTRYERSGNAWQPFLDYARGRVSVAARPIWTAMFKETGTGQKIKPEDLPKEVAKSAVPLPIGGSALTAAAKGLATGGNTEDFPGQFQKQAMQSMGLKTDTAPSPEQRMSSLARDFNSTKKITPSAEFYAGDFTDMTAAARRNNPDDMRKELETLLQKKTPAQIEKHFKQWASHPFTGQKGRETEFIRTLNPEQRATYIRAKQSRMQLGQRALQALHRMPPQLQRTGTD